jgi:hypothetical protein
VRIPGGRGLQAPEIAGISEPETREGRERPGAVNRGLIRARRNRLYAMSSRSVVIPAKPDTGSLLDATAQADLVRRGSDAARARK